MSYVLFFGWMIVINLFAAAVTVADKRAARLHRRRVPEATLLWIGLIGGAAGMLTTMKRIRHKTLKPKFMVTLPMMIVLHILAALCLWLWNEGVLTL